MNLVNVSCVSDIHSVSVKTGKKSRILLFLNEKYRHAGSRAKNKELYFAKKKRKTTIDLLFLQFQPTS